MSATKRLKEKLTAKIHAFLSAIVPALALGTFIFIPFLYYQNSQKLNFINRHFPGRQLPMRHLTVGADSWDGSRYAHYLSVLILFYCIITFGNVRLYLRGEVKYGTVISQTYYKLINDDTDNSYYLIEVAGCPHLINSLDSEKIGSVVKYVTVSDYNFPSIIHGSKFSSIFLHHLLSAGTICCMVGNTFVALFLLCYYQLMQFILFIRTRSTTFSRFKLVTQSIVALSYFLINMGIGILLLYMVYSRLSSMLLGGSLIFLTLLLMRGTAFFENMLYFFLQLSFDEIKNLLLEITAFVLKLSTSLAVLTEIYAAFKHPEANIIEITRKAFESVFG